MMQKTKSFSKRLFFAYSIFLIIILSLIFFSCYYLLLNSQQRRNAEIQIEMTQNIQNKLDRSLQNMDEIINGLMFNQHFMDIIQNNASGVFTETDSADILNYLAALDAPNFQTHRIIVFSHDFYYNWSKTEEEPFYVQVMAKGYLWGRDIIRKKGHKVILGTHSDLFVPKLDWVYSVARSIMDGEQCYGIIEVQNSYSQLEEICTSSQYSAETLVIDENGSLIYPREKDDQVMQILNEANFSKLKTDQFESGCVQLGDQMVSYSTSSYSGWTTIMYIPRNLLMPYAYRPLTLIMLMMPLTCIVSLILAFYMTKRMSAPLVALSKSLSQVSLNNLSVPLPPAGGIEEIDSILSTFHDTLDRLERSIALSIQARANEEHARYLALERQMNPHTLYNSLNVIESVCYINGDLAGSRLCLCLSRMLRYISDYSKSSYVLEDEVAYLNSYIDLITTRYDGRLAISVAVDDSLMQEVLPKYTLQPLVENAVQHGMDPEAVILHVSVTISRFEDGWQIDVIDDGRGFSPERLQEIRSRIDNWNNNCGNSSSIINAPVGNLAVINIYARCRILFGEAFRLQMENDDCTGGARVSLTIPYRKEENQ